MTHQLNPQEHEKVHNNHSIKNGGYSLRQVPAIFEFDDLTDDERTAILERPENSDPMVLAKTLAKVTTLTSEVCSECGFIERTICDHGIMYWTHRTDCSVRADNIAKNIPVEIFPDGLIDSWGKAFPDKLTTLSSEPCEGCLLLCPLCGADGT